MSEQKIEKLDRLASQDNISAANVVRLAIEAYNPTQEVEMPELMNLVAERLKDAIHSTQAANQKIENILGHKLSEDTNLGQLERYITRYVKTDG